MGNRGYSQGKQGRAVDGAVSCSACLGTGMRQPDVGPVRNLADNECLACDGFGWVDREGGGGGRARREGAEEAMCSVGGNFLQGSSNFSASKSVKIFRSKKAAPLRAQGEGVNGRKNHKGAAEAGSAANGKEGREV